MAGNPNELIVVDYNCPDHTADWVQLNHPRAEVIRVHGEDGFSLSKARNIGAQASKSDWLCFIDADIKIDSEWIAWMNINLTPGCFYLSDTVGGTEKKDVTGTFVCPRNEFLEIGGYDENFHGWGGEDIDLYYRLSKISELKTVRYPSRFVTPIPHDDTERVKFSPGTPSVDSLINALYLDAKIHIYSELTNSLSKATLGQIADSIRSQIGNPRLPPKTFSLRISGINAVDRTGTFVTFNLTIEKKRRYMFFGPRKVVYTIKELVR